MTKYIYIILLTLACAAVAVADVFLKKALGASDFVTVLKSPWVLAAAALYLFQIFIFTYLFFIGAKLVNVGIVQIILYGLIVVGSSMLFFHETLTAVKIIGIILGLAGVVLLTI
jgi:drug/metabolite transporter (DMT)-like permease